MKKVYYINKDVAPKDWVKFKRWFKLPSLNIPFTAEEAWVQLLGRKLPKDDSKRIKKKIK
jgi:hypothetical protein